MKQCFLVAWGIILAICFGGCGGGGGGSSETINPQPDYQSVAEISGTLQQARADSSSLEETARVMQNQPGVKEAKAETGSLTVVTDAGVNIVCLPAPNYTASPIQLSQTKMLASTCGKSVILCPLAGDPGFPQSGSYVEDIKTVCQSLGLEHRSVTGKAVTVESLADLGQYNLIFFLGHGGLSSVFNRSWSRQVLLLTGEEFSYQSFSQHLSELVDGQLVICAIEWGENRKETKWVYAVTPRFFQSRYSGKHLPGSLFYTASCSSMANDTLASALTSAGAGAYLGWTEPVRSSPDAGITLLTLLHRGATLGNAYSQLQNIGLAKEEGYDPTQNRFATSELRFYPASASGFVLSQAVGSRPTISISEPSDRQVVPQRLVSLRGMIAGMSDSLQYGYAVNGFSRQLRLASDGRFDEPVFLRSGQNALTVTAAGLQGSEAKTIRVDSSKPLDDLQIELSWDTRLTDLDLHLVRPGSRFWEEPGDCTWKNVHPEWGTVGELDDPWLIREDDNGYGPECIFLTRASEPGKYVIKVHYFNDHGISPTQAWVRISVKGTDRYFGPAVLSRCYEDVWYVADVQMPEGKIIPINQMENKTLMRLPPGLKKK